MHPLRVKPERLVTESDTSDNKWIIFRDAWSRYKQIIQLTDPTKTRNELRSACNSSVNEMLFNFVGPNALNNATEEQLPESVACILSLSLSLSIYLSIYLSLSLRTKLCPARSQNLIGPGYLFLLIFSLYLSLLISLSLSLSLSLSNSIVQTNRKVLKTIKEDNSTKLYTMKGSVFIFVQFKLNLLFVPVDNCHFGGHCPAGLLWHQQVTKCCQPITHCEAGHQVKPCMKSGEQDYCESCPKGQTNSFNTSSFDMKACKPDTCSSDTTPDKNGKCVCNLLKGYTGNDSRFCLNEGKHCLEGTELQLSGDCKPCAFQYYKDWEGYGFCKKQINCNDLHLEYKVRGNSKTAAICKKQQANYFDEQKQRNQSNTFGFQYLSINITESPVLQTITEHTLKSVHIKKDLFPKENLSTRILDYHQKANIKTSKALRYIENKHLRICKTNTHENIMAFKQQDIKGDWMCHGEDPYNISSPQNESTYVKIEPLSLNC
ncbi:unnamed protein product [Acanthosepion pharaonis]|uniref:Uncharacterized protein n=1 Tax=Acanthosepion pharaonis TaxID=158019 RepID=A0A812CFJ1_ACAPH|nr:unnamed protein product [Sepia pharaonis]